MREKVLTEDELTCFLKEINDKDDRIFAIHYMDLIDTILYIRLDEILVNKKCIPDFISQKVNLSYSLGAINEDEYHDLKQLIKIRNGFAHNFRFREFACQKEKINFKILSTLNNKDELSLKDQFLQVAFIVYEAMACRIYPQLKAFPVNIDEYNVSIETRKYLYSKF